MWFHCTSLLSSSVPLACRWPQAPVLPTPLQFAQLCTVALASFAGQLLITRGFQLEVASKVAAVNYSQVVYAYVFGVALLGNSVAILGLVGSVLVAIGVLATTQDKVPAKPVQLPHLHASNTDVSLVTQHHDINTQMPQCPLEGGSSGSESYMDAGEYQMEVLAILEDDEPVGQCNAAVDGLLQLQPVHVEMACMSNR